MFKQAKEEQEKADHTFEEEQQKEYALDLRKLGLDTSTMDQDHIQSSSTRSGGQGIKAAKRSKSGKATSLKPGSIVEVASGAFAGYSGKLKKLDKKTGLVCSFY